MRYQYVLKFDNSTVGTAVRGCSTVATIYELVQPVLWPAYLSVAVFGQKICFERGFKEFAQKIYKYTGTGDCLKPELGPDGSLGLNKDRYFGRNRKLKATEFACTWPKKTVVYFVLGYVQCTVTVLAHGIQ